MCQKILVGRRSKNDAYAPEASIGDEQVAASTVVVDSIFLGNLSVIH